MHPNAIFVGRISRVRPLLNWSRAGVVPRANRRNPEGALISPCSPSFDHEASEDGRGGTGSCFRAVAYAEMRRVGKWAGGKVDANAQKS